MPTSEQSPQPTPPLWSIPKSYLDQSGEINALRGQLKKVETSMDPVIKAAEHFDWKQPGSAWEPCFHLGSDGHFCGRAPWWDGHAGRSAHIYTSLADLLRSLKCQGPAAQPLTHNERVVLCLLHQARFPVERSTVSSFMNDAHLATATLRRLIRLDLVFTTPSRTHSNRLSYQLTSSGKAEADAILHPNEKDTKCSKP